MTPRLTLRQRLNFRLRMLSPNDVLRYVARTLGGHMPMRLGDVGYYYADEKLTIHCGAGDILVKLATGEVVYRGSLRYSTYDWDEITHLFRRGRWVDYLAGLCVRADAVTRLHHQIDTRVDDAALFKEN
jgi:hypothetical protein